MVLRATLVVLCIVLGLALFSGGDASGWTWGYAVVVVVASVAVGSDYAWRRANPGAVLGGTAGLACGLLLAGLAAWILETTIPAFDFAPVLGFLLLAIFPYLGLIYGVKIFTAAGILGQPGAVETGGSASTSNKILDTSVIIDGRIADLCETGFLEGAFILPQFILNELQHIADSSDPLKRGRGRRGLDVLNKIQKMVDIEVRIVEEDFPHIKEVDSKIVMLAKKMNAKVITNDLNLSKVAELQGVRVLNINELCNALKPVVLPVEQLRVYVLKYGMEVV